MEKLVSLKNGTGFLYISPLCHAACIAFFVTLTWFYTKGVTKSRQFGLTGNDKNLYEKNFTIVYSFRNGE
jgi:hypothetical protein